MTARCSTCGIPHPPSERGGPRCTNAADVGRKLATRLSLEVLDGGGCAASFHEMIRADWSTFMANTHGGYDWTDESTVYVSRHCLRCGSTLSLENGSVAARDARRNAGPRRVK